MLRISGVCEDGVHSAFLGNLVGGRVLNLVHFPQFVAVRGIVAFSLLQVNGACDALRVSVSCTSGPCSGPQAQYTHLEVLLAVHDAPRPTDSPGHLSATEVEVTGMSLGEYPTLAAAVQATAGVGAAEFTAGLLGYLMQKVPVCVSPNFPPHDVVR